MKFATVRLGKTSVEDIRHLAAMPGGIVKEAIAINVVCTQVPEELVEDTVVFLWLGSDNSKGMPTEWIQGFKAVGIVTDINRGAKYNDESTSTVSLKYVFSTAITRLDVLRDCPEAYYWCSSLPIIGLDDHSNQTIRCFAGDLERGEIGAFLYSLNSVCQTFRRDIVSIMPEIDNLFWATVKSPKTGDVLGASSAPETDMHHRLDNALKVFTENRVASQAGDGKNYDESCAKTRSEAARIDGDYLTRCDYDAFRKTLNSVQVANSFFSKHTETEKRLLGDFIAAVRQDPRDISFYLEKENQPGVPGIGPAMLTAFLTRTRPDLFVFFTDQMFESVKFLGLTEDAALPPLTTDSYNTYKGIQTAIRDRMREMGIKAENGNDADYLTVNEFTWFVSENLDSIKEEIMKNEMKNVDASVIGEPGKSLALNADDKNDLLMLRLMAALRAKPFVILAGHSGTGKSRLVRKLAYMTCNVKELQDDSKGPQNFCMVQVKPNWHDSTDLLGYRSAIRKDEYVGTKLVEFLFRAYAYPDTPFFVCLDEMNLAPVEQYFAEFLSAMESLRPADATKPDGAFVSDPISDLSADKDAANLSKLGCATKPAFKWLTEHGLTIPKNLFVVGTVNMDETTNQFSRKVLDRAMTIEMTDANLSDFGKVSEPSFADRIDNSIIEKLIRRPIRVEKLDEDDCREDAPLLAVQKCLEKTPFAIAFRFANEYTLYKRGVEAFDPGKTMKVDPLDHAVLMKVLPRIAGTKESVRTIFGGREDFAVATDAASGNSLLGILSDESLLSNQKMRAILARNESYLTFWP